MQRMSAPVRWLCVTLCVPLMASAQQIGEPDCKSRISHSGFAEYVMPSEGGTHKLAMKASPSVKWTVRNSSYLDWIEILDGDSGVGPGTMTIQLHANTGKFCRIGVLTISGLTRVYGLPIIIVQRGTETAGAGKQTELSHPSVINLAPFPNNSPQTLSEREYKKVTPKR